MLFVFHGPGGFDLKAALSFWVTAENTDVDIFHFLPLGGKRDDKQPAVQPGVKFFGRHAPFDFAQGRLWRAFFLWRRDLIPWG